MGYPVTKPSSESQLCSFLYCLHRQVWGVSRRIWVGRLFSARSFSMSQPFIRIRGLVKHYHMGGQVVRALDGVDVDIHAHTFTVVMGPSGSGKSTLLYLLGGLDRATSGEISVDGQRIDQMDENALALFRRRTMGFVFQSFNLIPSMSALDNVAFPMQFAGVNATHRKEQ